MTKLVKCTVTSLTAWHEIVRLRDFSCVMSCVLSTSGRPYNIHADDATDSQTSYRQWLMMSTHSIGFVRSVDVGFSSSSHRAFSTGRASNARHNLYREWLNIDGFTEILSSYMLKIFAQKHSGRSSNVYKSIGEARRAQWSRIKDNGEKLKDCSYYISNPTNRNEKYSLRTALTMQLCGAAAVSGELERYSLSHDPTFLHLRCNTAPHLAEMFILSERIQDDLLLLKT